MTSYFFCANSKKIAKNSREKLGLMLKIPHLIRGTLSSKYGRTQMAEGFRSVVARIEDFMNGYRKKKVRGSQATPPSWRT